jgi:hypothetical protein
MELDFPLHFSILSIFARCRALQKRDSVFG